MDIDIQKKYNQSFIKLKTLNVFNKIPEYIPATCDLCLYGISFGNMKYNTFPNLDNIDKYVVSKISDIMSLFLYSGDDYRVYGPMLTLKDGRRSLDICDLNQEFITALYDNAENLFQQPVILSRIFDVIWVSKQLKDKRNYIAAEKAFSYYQILFQTALNAKNYHFSQNIISRIHNLVLQLGKEFKERINHFNSLLPLLDITTTSDNIFFLYTIWEIILNINWKDDNSSIYQKIISQIQTYLAQEQNLSWAEKCSHLLCKIYHKTSDIDKSQEVLENLSKRYIYQAENTDHPIAQIHYLSQAIETLRRINKNPCKQKIMDLYNKIQAIQTQKDTYSQTFTSEIDITTEVNDLIKKYQEASFPDCIMGLWLSKNFFPTPEDIQKEITTSEQTLTDFIPTSYQNHLGQTVSVANDYKEYSHKKLSRNLVYGMRIKPLLDLLNERFSYNKDAFSSIVLYNPMVPEGYEDTFAKGIYYFIKCQYLEAATILVPLIENSLRHILSINQPTIHKLDSSEIFANKIDLNELFDLVMQQNIVDNNLLWHLKELMTDSRINIRNYIAHGLFPYNYFYSEEVIVLLFLIFALIFDPFGNETIKELKKLQ